MKQYSGARRWSVAVILLVVAAHSPHSQARGWVEAGLFGELLSVEIDPAFGQYLAGAWTAPATRTWYGQLEQASRFGENDLEVQAGVYQTLTGPHSLHLNGTWSPTSNVRPDYSVYGGLYLVPWRGWGLEPGYRYIADDGKLSHVVSMMVEHYWQAWRFAWTPYLSWLEDDGGDTSWALSNALQATYFYSERSQVGVGLSLGDALERDPMGTQIITSMGASVQGLHYYRPDWALSYRVSTDLQADSFDRYGWRAGIRYAF